MNEAPDQTATAQARSANDVLIFGYGYLGRRVGQLWVQKGLNVHATTRGEDQAKIETMRADGVKPIICDVTHLGSNVLPMVDTALWCVGYDRGDVNSMEDIYEEGLKQVLNALPTPKRFLYVSSTGVYGDAGGEWVDEHSAVEPTDHSAQVCLDAEKILDGFVQEKAPHMTAIILRLAGIYGPGRLMGERLLKEGDAIPGEPEKSLNLIHVDDAVRIVETVRCAPNASPLYCVSDGLPPTRREFYTYLADLLGTGPPTFDPEAARRHRGDRKVSNGKLQSDFQMKPENWLHPNYKVGLKAIVQGE